MLNSGVYEIRNLLNDKRYIGSAVNLSQRWRDHRSGLRSGRHFNRHLQRSWNKYGEENFEFRPFAFCHPNELIVWEQSAMDLMKPEYNIAPNAGSQLGFRHTLESRAKVSAAAKKQVPRSGYRHSDESRAKMASARIGRRASPETKAKMSAAQRKRRASAETKAKMSASARNRSPETKARLSASGKIGWVARKAAGNVVSTELRKKLSDAGKAYWRRRREQESKNE